MFIRNFCLPSYLRFAIIGLSFQSEKQCIKSPSKCNNLHIRFHTMYINLFYRCKNKTYTETLPSVSIIICFYNEHFHTLIRSIHSILERTPRSLLEEIVLVDDYSDTKHLHTDVADYVANLSKTPSSFDANGIYRPVPIKVLKTHRREGLIRARLFGAEHSRAKVRSFCNCKFWFNVII